MLRKLEKRQNGTVFRKADSFEKTVSAKAPAEAMRLMSGNEAIAQAALDAGCRFYAGYPITPQNEIIAYMAKNMPKRGVFIQSESEISAINMVYGASASGVRAMTSSSSPGISLKQEGISYLAGAQLPAVIINIMRAGPGLGNIWPAQSDYFQAVKGGGHGDYHCPVLAPAGVQEAYTLTLFAFELADEFRTPVIVLGDGMLGQMMEPLLVHSSQFPVSSKEKKNIKKPWAVTGCKGRNQNIIRSLFLSKEKLEENNLNLQKKYKKIQASYQRYETFQLKGAQVMLVAYGTVARICKQAAVNLKEKGIRAGVFRPVTLWPFPSDGLNQIILENNISKILVAEASYGQMLEDVRLSVNGRARVSFLGRAGGSMLGVEEIIRQCQKTI